MHWLSVLLLPWPSVPLFALAFGADVALAFGVDVALAFGADVAMAFGADVALAFAAFAFGAPFASTCTCQTQSAANTCASCARGGA